MRTLTLWQIEMIPWYVFGAYWAITWLRVQPTKKVERRVDRLLTVILMGLALALLFSSRLGIGPLGTRFVPARTWVAWTGIVLTSLGVAIAIWARYCLGQFWSAQVTLKQGHQLIRSGPYQFVRHPIYSGLVLAAAGTALVVGEWRGLLALLLAFVAHSGKARREEALLATEFGEEYQSYRQTTGFLLPRFPGASKIGAHPAG